MVTVFYVMVLNRTININGHEYFEVLRILGMHLGNNNLITRYHPCRLQQVASK